MPQSPATGRQGLISQPWEGEEEETNKAHGHDTVKKTSLSLSDLFFARSTGPIRPPCTVHPYRADTHRKRCGLQREEKRCTHLESRPRGLNAINLIGVRRLSSYLSVN